MAARISTGKVLAIVAVLGGVTLPFVLVASGFERAAATAAGLGVFAIGLWATNQAPLYLATLVILLVGVVADLAPLRVIFAGFYTTTFWLVFSGLVIATAFRDTGLSDRVAAFVTARSGATYRRTVLVLALAGIGLVPIVPASSVRIVMLVPIATSLAGQMGFAVGSRGYCGLVFAAAFSTITAGFAVLPANVMNMLIVGMNEALYHRTISFIDWAVMAGPTLGVLYTAGMLGTVFWLYPAVGTALPPKPAVSKPWSAPERRLLAILAVALAFWTTDRWHGVGPAWIGLAAAILCLTPRIGFVGPEAFNAKISWGFLVFTAGVLSYAAIAEATGLARTLGEWFVTVAAFAPDQSVRTFAVLAATSSIIGLVVTPFGTMVTLPPLAGAIAEATQWPVTTVLMTIFGGALAMAFPYQAPPVLLSLQLGAISHREGIRFYAALGALMLIVLLPLTYLWWQVLGLF
ncbi:MAG: SLC13 family permease [Alphaproteobacteria bacterium]|nr:SLC13 family permease [Alphaproteobacteria bacterium]